MKKILTSLVVVAGLVTSAYAQRQCDIAFAGFYGPNYDTTINCGSADSFQAGYIFINNGPDNLIAGDTLYFKDAQNDSGEVWYTVAENDLAPGDTVVNWGWMEHIDLIKTLVDTSTFEYVYPPFADGAYGYPMISAGFAADSTVIVDPVDTNNYAIILINIDCGSTGINEIAQQASIELFPNPATDAATLNYNLTNSATASIRVTDVTGRAVLVQELGKLNAGSGSYNLNLSSLSNGLYNVEFATENGRIVSKLTVRK